MSDTNTLYAQALAHPLAAEALFSADPAWVWSSTGERILWSNEAGCRFFDTKSMPGLLARTFRRVSPATVQIARMSQIGEIGVAQESPLRFFLGMNPVTVQARLEPIVLSGGGDAVFVRAWDIPRPSHNRRLDKMALRLVKLFSRGDAPAAILTLDGEIKEASKAFRAAKIEDRVLKQAASQLHSEKTSFVTVFLRNDPGALHLSAIPGKNDAPPRIFATLGIRVDGAAVTPQEMADGAGEPPEKLPQAESAPDTFQEDRRELPSFVFSADEIPTRFLFTLDADLNVAFVSPEFEATLGGATGAIAGQNWGDLMRRFNLDPESAIAHKIEREAIWSETVYWPISGTAPLDGAHGPLRAPVSITAMPVFSSARLFEGFRGFGSIATAQASVHDALDTPAQDVGGEPEIPQAEWATLIETEPQNPAGAGEPAQLPTDGDDETAGNNNRRAGTSTGDDADELEWHLDAEDEAAEPPQKMPPPNASDPRPDARAGADSKIVPLHRRPIAVPNLPTQSRETSLSKPELQAFRQIAEALSARLEGDVPGETKFDDAGPDDTRRDNSEPDNLQDEALAPPSASVDAHAHAEDGSAYERNIDFDAASIVEGHKPGHETAHHDRSVGDAKTAATAAAEILSARDGILNRLPLGLIVSRDRKVLFANRTVLDFLGYDGIEAFQAAGGVNTLFEADTQADPGSFVGRDVLKHLVIKADHEDGHIPQTVRAKMADGTTVSVDLRLQSGDWQGEEALLMALSAKMETPRAERSEQERISQLLGQSTDIMDIASDGILIIDTTGRLIHANSSAEALFGRDRAEMRDLNIVSLFAEESRKSVADYLDGLTSNGVASVLNDGREAIGQESGGGLIPLFITIGRLESNAEFDGGVFCAVLRDITQWKRAEEELIESRRIAENANAQKSDFLASISHEIRTPLNAIIGFSEVMMEQHFGPMENPRYLEYARDINISGNHLVSLVNDLLDLSKIEAGKLDLTFSSVALNAIIQECVALMQPEANRDRIIIRTSLSETLPPVVADARSIRQIALNLLSNAVKFTKSGGQVIISTTLEENGEVAIRVRDTGIGMSADDLQYAMQPFRQVHSNRQGLRTGTGLGLPLTKALVEANRARFTIDSRVDYGTLIQVIFPNERVLAR